METGLYGSLQGLNLRNEYWAALGEACYGEWHEEGQGCPGIPHLLVEVWAWLALPALVEETESSECLVSLTSLLLSPRMEDILLLAGPLEEAVSASQF